MYSSLSKYKQTFQHQKGIVLKVSVWPTMERNKGLATRALPIANRWQWLLCENFNDLLMDPQANVRAGAWKRWAVKCLENPKLATAMFQQVCQVFKYGKKKEEDTGTSYFSIPSAHVHSQPPRKLPHWCTYLAPLGGGSILQKDILCKTGCKMRARFISPTMLPPKYLSAGLDTIFPE